MSDTSTKPIVDSAGPGQIPRKPSDILADYERLLRLYTDQLGKVELNPYQSYLSVLLKLLSPAFLSRFWKSAISLLKVPNTLRLDLTGGALILQELEGFDDQTLRGIAECSRINHRHMFGRSVLGWLPKLTAVLTAVTAFLLALKDLDIDIDIPTDLVSWLASAAVGLLFGSIANLIIWLPSIGIIRALDDLIAIAVAQRGTRKPD